MSARCGKSCRTVGVEADADARLVASVRLHVVLHPAREEDEQPRARGQLNVGVPVGDGALEGSVNDAGTRIAEGERARARGHLEIEAAREQRALVKVQEVESAPIVQVDPGLQSK